MLNVILIRQHYQEHGVSFPVCIVHMKNVKFIINSDFMCVFFLKTNVA